MLVWRALIARAVEANNEEVAAGTGMSPNEYMDATENRLRCHRWAIPTHFDSERRFGAQLHLPQSLRRRNILTVEILLKMNLNTQLSFFAVPDASPFTSSKFTVAGARRGDEPTMSRSYGCHRNACVAPSCKVPCLERRLPDSSQTAR